MLLAAPLVAQEDASLAALRRLDKEKQAATQEFFRPYTEAKKAGKTYKLDYTKHPDRTFGPRYEALAREHKGKPGALKALTALLRMAPTREGKQAALDAILQDHLEAADLKSSMFSIRYAHWADREKALRAIIQATPHRDVKGWALLQLGCVLKSDQPANALEALREVANGYKDVVYRKPRSLADAATGEIYEIEHLSVGKLAPEIDGEDIDGVVHKLSDYLGKVVMLDFWGDW